LAILYLSLSRLDKVTGYGQPNQFLVLAQYVFLATVVSSCIYQIFNRAQGARYRSIASSHLPGSHFPIELARNLVAREMAPNAAHLYVTKLYAGEIYGLRFEKSYWVDRYSLIDGVFQKKDSNLLNGGGGTLDPQTPIIASWEWDIVKMLLNKQRAGK
jgi:hypothetical protein